MTALINVDTFLLAFWCRLLFLQSWSAELFLLFCLCGFFCSCFSFCFLLITTCSSSACVFASNSFPFQTKGDQRAVCLPGRGVFPAGLFYPVPQDSDIIGHHVIKGLELLLDSLELHSFSLSLFGPVDTNQVQPLQQSTAVLTCPYDRETLTSQRWSWPAELSCACFSLPSSSALVVEAPGASSPAWNQTQGETLHTETPQNKQKRQAKIFI